MAGSLQQYGQRVLRAFLTKPAIVAALPAAFWTLYSLGGETALATMAIAMPILIVAMGTQGARAMAASSTGQDAPSTSARAFESLAAQYLQEGQNRTKDTALFEVEIDNLADIETKYGAATAVQVRAMTSARLRDLLREIDLLFDRPGGQYSLCLAPLEHFDLALCVQFAGRIQAAAEHPMDLEGQTIFATVSVGFCQAGRAPGPSFAEWRDAAQTALRAAKSGGSATIRAFTAEMTAQQQRNHSLTAELPRAMTDGQIRAWFQPQLSTDTGQISGFEALARWEHPALGIIPPGEFLPLIEAAGLEEKLAELMLCNSCDALATWDRAGLNIPQIGINFSHSELQDPEIADKLAWMLDRFDLTPERLTIEVLENVASSAPDDIISININKLTKMGCSVDLDDFGTGSTSITSLRQYAVNRIKIDRSFVIKSDQDPEQQRMVAAILLMAERLGIEAVAEGVETAGEHALLAQLGCDHVQGFGIARPMPFDQTVPWIEDHQSKIANIPRIARNG